MDRIRDAAIDDSVLDVAFDVHDAASYGAASDGAASDDAASGDAASDTTRDAPPDFAVDSSSPSDSTSEASLDVATEDALADTSSTDVGDAGPLVPGAVFFKPNNAAMHFGQRVVVSRDGGTVVVSTSSPIRVFVFRRNGNLWQTQELRSLNFDAADEFGTSVALSADGNTIVVGAPFEDTHGRIIDATSNENAPNSGAAYVFSATATTTHQQVAFLKAHNIDAGDRFGASVAISSDGRRIVVGAPFEDSTSVYVDSTPNNDGEDDGALYMYEHSAPTWGLTHYFKYQSSRSLAGLGTSVAISGDGDTVVACPVRYDSQSSHPVGFRFADNVWRIDATAESYPIQSAPVSTALSYDGNTLAVGLPNARASGPAGAVYLNVGGVYVYVRSPNTAVVWPIVYRLSPSEPTFGDAWGNSLALSADASTLLVGAPGENSSGAGWNSISNSDLNDSGAVYLLRNTNGAWRQTAFIKALNPGTNDRFGHAVAMSGDARAIFAGAPFEASTAQGVGSPMNESAPETGAVYMYPVP